MRLKSMFGCCGVQGGVAECYGMLRLLRVPDMLRMLEVRNQIHFMGSNPLFPFDEARYLQKLLLYRIHNAQEIVSSFKS